MQRCNLLGMNQSQYTNDMLYSRIQPQHNQRIIQNQYISHKIPKVDKKGFEIYQIRAKIVHPNIPKVVIQQKSPFYHTVYLEKRSLFTVKDLLMLPINKRIMVLTEILSAVKALTLVYGFFYITEKMIGYSSTRKISLWIHENVLENKRSHPINHGKLSQEIFVADFKSGFGGNLRQLRQFRNAKKVENLIALLSTNKNVAQSIYMSQPAKKESHIHRKNSQLTISDIDERLSFNTAKNENRFQHEFFKHHGLTKTESLNSLRKPISFSYLPNQLEKSMIGSSKIIPVKALASSMSMQSLHFRRPERENRLNTSNSSLNFCNFLHNSSSHKDLTKSIIPKVQFTYQNPHLVQAWKKKPNNFSKFQVSSSQSMTKSQSAQNLAFNAQQYHKQPLKISFPHTTANSFVPFASNGNINLTFKESANFQHKGIRINKQDLIEPQIQVEQHISENSNEVQMDLDVLFSDDEELYSREQEEQLEMILEEFENVLLS